MGKATIPNYEALIGIGLDPKTGLPVKVSGSMTEQPLLKEKIIENLTIVDRQNALNRYVWYNLPDGLTGELIERILYFKGQGMFFYNDIDSKFYFLPYALQGTIDVYGRFIDVTPLPFNGTSGRDGKTKPWIPGMSRKVIYDFPDDVDEEMFENGCLLLHDYNIGMSQTIIPRNILQQPIISAEAEAVPLARTSLIAHSGVKGVRVSDEDQASNVKAASRSIYNAAIKGDPWIPIVGGVEFQDLTEGNGTTNLPDFLAYMQMIDNFRLSQYGLANGGIFEKQGAYVNNQQAENQTQNIGMIYQAGLTLRQDFCDMANAIWGCGMSVMPSETASNTDLDLDGDCEDGIEQDGSDEGGQPDNV